MPWIEVDEPHARPPRVSAVAPSARWTGPLAIDRDWGELSDVEVDREAGFDPSGCRELSIVDSVIDGVELGGGDEPPPTVEVRRSVLRTCDLSRVRIRGLHAAHLDGCKLIGTDLSGAVLADVVLERCALRYANLRMSRLRRVRFVDCTLDEVDAFEVDAEDVAFPGTTLDAVNVDRLQASRVDLREADRLVLNGAGRLTGCLVAEYQLPGLAYSLAMAAGLDIEQT